jgi:hypothetical protein
MPESSTTLWATCGRRERENRRTEIADLRPPSSFDVTVKGIPVFGTAPLFAGRRSNEDLGRSVVLDAGILPLSRGAPMTADVRRPPRRGTTSAGATKRRHPASMENPSSIGDASFTRSFDPFTFTSRQHRGRKPTVVRRSRRHRGRASLRKQEKPTPGSARTDDERLAACHRFRKGAAWCVRKGRRSWPPSLRGSTSSGFGSSHVVRSCRSRQATKGPE